MKLLFFAFSLLCSISYAQDFPNPSPQQTSAIPGARFEVVQSPIAAKWTFRLDRYTGRVWQLVKTKADSNAWEETDVYGLAPNLQAKQPRFQIFTSGIAARHTFLIDTSNGRTWVVVQGQFTDLIGQTHETTSWELFGL